MKYEINIKEEKSIADVKKLLTQINNEFYFVIKSIEFEFNSNEE